MGQKINEETLRTFKVEEPFGQNATVTFGIKTVTIGKSVGGDEVKVDQTYFLKCSCGQFEMSKQCKHVDKVVRDNDFLRRFGFYLR